MTIKVIEDGPTITITRSEEARLLREWQKCCQYTVDPPTFEAYVRSQKRAEADPDRFSRQLGH